MKKGFLYSAIFHLVVFSMLFFKLPYRDKVIKTTPINIDIVTEIPKKAVPVKEVKKAEPVKKVEPPKPKVKAPKPVARKPKPKKVVKKVVKKTVKKKIPVKKAPKISKEELEKRKLEAERKKKEDAFKSLLSDLQTIDEIQKPVEQSSAIPLSYSELAEIKYQIQRCWQIPPSVTNTDEVLILRVRLNRDGSLIDVRVVDESKYKTNHGLKLLAESALRAVEKCAPLRNLPIEKFASWRDLELGFNPQDVQY